MESNIETSAKKLIDANALAAQAQQQNSLLQLEKSSALTDLEIKQNKLVESGKLLDDLRRKNSESDDQISNLERNTKDVAVKLIDANAIVDSAQQRNVELKLEKSSALANLEAEKKKVSDLEQKNHSLKVQIMSMKSGTEASTSFAGQEDNKPALGKRRNIPNVDSTPKVVKSEGSTRTPRKSAQNKTPPKTSAKKAKKEGDIFEVEALVDHKFEDSTWHFLVRWKGYSPAHDLWVPEADLNCTKMLTNYRKQANL